MLRDAIGWTTSVLVLIASGHPVASAADTPDKISFNRDIRPILSNHCYACHGPDAQQRQADFRVDRKLDAYSDRGGYHPLVPGDPANSALYGRIATDDPDEIMPPTDFGKPLSGEQIDLIRRWIQQGADWAEHWSFVPPQRSEPAAIRDEQFARNAIDRFVLARLEAVGLQPSPAAAKTSLIRRVTFDLTGLPPTIEETDTFLADDSPDAYEKVVDRLLDSPHYGEHMARQWLDLARYSDTHGMHTDSQRSLWPFRDWLIRAFNQNMPFDQFTIEQLAGDLLPDPTRDQLVATGFNRCNPSTDEGGSIAEEMRVRYAIDRVETIGTVWMGLSLTCTVCHDHKFDPIRQREFYQLFAYYANIDENPMNGNALAPEPSVDVPTSQQEERRSQLQAQIAALEQKIRQEIDAVKYETPIEPGNVEAHEPRDYIWFDDSLPEGAEPDGNEGADSWQWVTAEKGPVHSGEKSHTRTAIGLSQHYFTAAKPTLTISAGDRLFAYVYLDANNPPLEIMLNFKTVDWEHRAYWGENRIDWGDDNSAARLPMGPLPQTGQWVRLEVDSGAVGLQPGDEVNGWAFTQFDGTVYWDQAGLVTANPHPILFESLLAWEESQRDVEESSLPEDIQETLKTDRTQRSDAQRKQIREYFIEHAFAGTRATFVNLHEQLDDHAGQGVRFAGHLPVGSRPVRPARRVGKVATQRTGRVAIVARGNAIQPPGSIPLARLAGASLDGPRNDESPVAIFSWRRHCQNGRGIRRPGRLADTSTVARLAGGRIYGERLGRETDAEVDRHVRDLPAVRPGLPRALPAGSGEPVAGTRTPVSAGCRGNSRPGAGGQWLAGQNHRRQGGQTVSARRHLAVSQPDGQQHRELRTGARRRTVSPQHVHVLEADLVSAHDGRLRRPFAQHLQRPARADEHAIAGARLVE